MIWGCEMPDIQGAANARVVIRHDKLRGSLTR
jgi:hypothetical protein